MLWYHDYARDCGYCTYKQHSNSQIYLKLGRHSGQIMQEKGIIRDCRDKRPLSSRDYTLKGVDHLASQNIPCSNGVEYSQHYRPPEV